MKNIFAQVAKNVHLIENSFALFYCECTQIKIYLLNDVLYPYPYKETKLFAIVQFCVEQVSPLHSSHEICMFVS